MFPKFLQRFCCRARKKRRKTSFRCRLALNRVRPLDSDYAPSKMSEEEMMMDNRGFRNVEKETELTAVEVNGKASSTSEAIQAGKSTSKTITCTPEVCREARRRFQPPDLQDSPWHTKKTWFLVAIIIILIIWIAVYATLSQLKLL